MINKIFDKTYVINLKKRPDRLVYIKEELKRVGINDYEVFEGVDGILLDYNTSLLKGEIGIHETHLRILKDAVKNGYKDILILEDDVVFTDEYETSNELIENLPENWDFIYFGGNHLYGKTPEEHDDLFLKLNFTVALHCVGIRSNIFELLINSLEKDKNKQVDGIYASLHSKLNAFSPKKNIAKQRPDFSDIQNKFVDYGRFFK